MKRNKNRSSAAERRLTRGPFVLRVIAAAAACIATTGYAADTTPTPPVVTPAVSAAGAAPDSPLVAQASPGPAAAPAQASAAPEVAKVESITVTASKRVERLIDTPTAITALDAQKLENLGVENFTSYAGLVPNLNQVGGVAAGQGTVVIRGLFSGSQQITNTTAFYIGETPFSANATYAAGSLVTPDPDLLDVARIEVLKGPQGTLYGANALGGLIRLIPKEPDTDDLYGSVRLGGSKVGGGGDGFVGKVSVNVPVAKGLLGLQVGAFSRQDGGFTTNTFTGNNHLGEAKYQGGGITALLTPTKDLRFTLRALIQTIKVDGPTEQDNVLATGTPVTGERQFSSPFALPTRSKYDILSFGGEYETAWGTVTGTVSHSKYAFDTTIDGVGYAQLFRSDGFFCVVRKVCAPSNDYYAVLRRHAPLDKKSAELRFASKRLGAVEFLAGLFYTKEDFVNGASALGSNAAGVAPAAPFNNILLLNDTGSYKETAVFGDLTYYLTPDVDVGAGVRRAKNDQHFNFTLVGLLGSPTAPVSSEDSSTTYQVTARWRPTKELSTYARVSTGYRPGGPQSSPAATATSPTFAPDTVTNYELGVKSSSLGGRLAFDAAVYHIDWKNVQLNSTLNGILFVGNAGKTTVGGFEVQGTYTDPSGLSVGGSFGFNDAKLKEIGTTTAASVGAVAGDRLPGSPKLTGALYGGYRFAVFGDAQANVGATLRYQGDKHAAYSAPINTNPDYLIPAYTTLDLRAGVQWSRYNVRLGIDNVTDKNGVSGYLTTRVLASQNTIPSQAYLIRPRTYTATFGVEF